MSALGKTILHQETKCCDKKIIGKEDIEDLGFFPKDCSNGAGWDDSTRKLETIVEGDSYKINWASLLKQPSCVKSITLLKNNGRKGTQLGVGNSLLSQNTQFQL